MGQASDGILEGGKIEGWGDCQICAKVFTIRAHEKKDTYPTTTYSHRSRARQYPHFEGNTIPKTIFELHTKHTQYPIFSTQYLKITIQYQKQYSLLFWKPITNPKQYFNNMKNLKQYPIFSPNISIEQTISHTIFLSSFVGNTIPDTIFLPHCAGNTKPKTIFDFRKNTKQYPIISNIQYNNK